MARLKNVESWMNWWGWTNNGGPGAVKLDTDHRTIARHGDAVWQEDIDRAIRRDERDQADDELIDAIGRH